MAKTLTEPHHLTIGTVSVRKKPPSGGQVRVQTCSLLRVMKGRFLVPGLAAFAVVFVLAILPVLAQGGTVACTIKGTSGADLLMGTAAHDVICGYGGNDVITAKGGNDTVYGGSGADTIYGDTGRDYLYGGSGNDRLYARDSTRDHIFGGRGYDYARVDKPLDVLRSIESR
jgi:Ca2+-binding RTX toxin-like protein